MGCYIFLDLTFGRDSRIDIPDIIDGINNDIHIHESKSVIHV